MMQSGLEETLMSLKRKYLSHSTALTFFIALLLGIMLTTSAIAADPIVTDSTSNSTVKSDTDTDTTVKSPPPSAISPSISGSNSDLCTVGVSGAVQTQILGVSTGQTYRDANCERLKLSKTLYDMGMKVAAVSVMCQDRRVFDAMAMAGTPCPYNGKIGEEAYELWKKNPQKMPAKVDVDNEKKLAKEGMVEGLTIGGILAVLAFVL
ncbi:MAG: hypothetical protein CMD92_08455 [Gammaproteobacteria bacterium]|nr:hypothetical protein [Gammaproteobacteria bacterium]|tara:strand:- start:593 stop:1213 length:621 start_codon:yes stop_codon:yes gene_type:complete